ncbi:biopolymer transporter ExbD [Alteromonadaceae bacterium M269]|nr:biopolymer transporter ExbD [Alteromonadaceae bacterium M269]
MKNKYAVEEEEANVDLTPMMDIVFIMLIFFIVTTTFVNERGLSVNRPKDNKTPTPITQQNISIKVDELGTIMLNGRITDIERVTANVQTFIARTPTDTAVVLAHPDINHGLVVAIMDKVTEAGISNLSVVVEKTS